MTEHRARVVWEGGRDDLRAHRVELSDEVLAGSCQPAFGGDPARADPEQLFVAALSSCHMLWFLDFARRERLRVTAYEDEPFGTMDATRFERVVLRPAVAFAAPVEGAAEARLHHDAHEACFLAKSVCCPVEVQPRALVATPST